MKGEKKKSQERKAIELWAAVGKRPGISPSTINSVLDSHRSYCNTFEPKPWGGGGRRGQKERTGGAGGFHRISFTLKNRGKEGGEENSSGSPTYPPTHLPTYLGPLNPEEEREAAPAKEIKLENRVCAREARKGAAPPP